MKFVNRSIITLFCLYVLLGSAFAQSYHALNGSPFAGVISNFSNPASAINTPYQWDFSVLGGQSNTINNGIHIANYKLGDKIPTNIITPTSGKFNRSIENDADLHLLNFRYNLNKKSCISFGMRMRTYTYATSSPFDFKDTISDLNSFLFTNAGGGPYNLSLTNNAWFETDISYAKVIKNTDDYSISGGATIEILKGLSGVYSNISNLSFSKVNNANGVPQYNSVNSAEFLYMYSDNYSVLDSQNSVTKNLLNFKKAAKRSIGLSFGFEYVLKDNVFDEPDNPLNYKLKVSASIMDLGFNRFSTNGSSFDVLHPNSSATDTGIINQLDHGITRNNLKRTLINNFTSSKNLDSKYKISLPTRLVISIDKPLGENFYINGMFNVNFYSKTVSNIYNIKTTELNRIIITPRFETNKFGLYMPFQYTEQHEVMTGAAIKFGPIVMGLHNINWIEKKKAFELNGGGYFALHFTPSLKKYHHSLDCFQLD